MKKTIKIGEKEIGLNPYFVAEYGVNHNGSLERAKEAIVAAARAGADAIKFQTYTADELVCKETPKFWEFEDDKDKDQHQAYEELGNQPKEWWPELMKVCEENKIEFLTTCFSTETADYFNELGMKAFKVASSDMSTLPFLEHIAKYGKPIILSTGASTMKEIHEAVDTIDRAGNRQIILLHCTLCYPTMYKDKNPHFEDANLNLIQTLEEEFPEYPIGISDHTLGNFSSMIAVAMGATMVEKHYTTDKTLGKSADHWFSVDPNELSTMIQFSKIIETLKGSKEKKVFDCEKETRVNDKRSIVSKIEIPEGTVITREMLTFKRPGTGIWPKDINRLIGEKSTVTIPADTVIKWDDIL
ncbi:acetylneuraminic acid synthetase [bacterium]|nr:acetylneuraminic acid synthetase [bacterium]